MRRMWIASVLMFGIGIGCVAATVAQNFVVPPVRAGANPTRWEVRCVGKDTPPIDNQYVNNAHKEGGWNHFLMKMGSEGWEPFEVIHENFAMNGVCFKRPLP